MLLYCLIFNEIYLMGGFLYFDVCVDDVCLMLNFVCMVVFYGVVVVNYVCVVELMCDGYGKVDGVIVYVDGCEWCVWVCVVVMVIGVWLCDWIGVCKGDVFGL